MKMRMTQRVCISHAAMLAMLRHVMGPHQFLVTEVEINDNTKPGKPGIWSGGCLIFEGTLITGEDKPHYFSCILHIIHTGKVWKVHGGYLSFEHLKTGDPRRRKVGQTSRLASINFNWSVDEDLNLPMLPLDQPKTCGEYGSFKKCLEGDQA